MGPKYKRGCWLCDHCLGVWPPEMLPGGEFIGEGLSGGLCSEGVFAVDEETWSEAGRGPGFARTPEVGGFDPIWGCELGSMGGDEPAAEPTGWEGMEEGRA